MRWTVSEIDLQNWSIGTPETTSYSFYAQDVLQWKNLLWCSKVLFCEIQPSNAWINLDQTNFKVSVVQWCMSKIDIWFNFVFFWKSIFCDSNLCLRPHGKLRDTNSSKMSSNEHVFFLPQLIDYVFFILIIVIHFSFHNNMMSFSK